MSIGSILNMARAGMSVQQAAIQTASQNISNATTEGYSRQRADTATSLPTVFPYGTIGTGVEITGISRARDVLLDATYRSDASGATGADTTAASLNQIQGIFNEPSDNGLSASLDAFWSSWSDLSTDPTNTAAKSVVRQSGQTVATKLNQMASQIDQLDQSNREAMNADVNKVNELGGQIAQYNTQILSAESNGNSANDLRDARDRLLDQLSKLAGGQVVERTNGTVGVYISGRMIVDGATVKPLQMIDGQPPTVAYSGSNIPLAGIGGSLGAEITLSSTHIPDVMAKLDSLAKGIVQSVNAIHSTGKIYSGTPPVASAAGNFFDVTNPAPSGVDPRLTARGMRLATTMTDANAVAVSGAAATGPGNNDAALALAGLQSSSQTITSAAGATVATTTLGDFYNSIIGDLATTTSQAQDDSTVKTTMMTNANTRRQSVSGVTTDEELINVIQHQHSYQAAARLVNTVDQMMQTLIGLGQ
ncbi:MAG: hypothetical protein JWM41_4634 [Gemmatimonadetes bacterium]|nr:hypothetical protein [Gemmatimonadota bacterium]